MKPPISNETLQTNKKITCVKLIYLCKTYLHERCNQLRSHTNHVIWKTVNMRSECFPNCFWKNYIIITYKYNLHIYLKFTEFLLVWQFRWSARNIINSDYVYKILISDAFINISKRVPSNTFLNISTPSGDFSNRFLWFPVLLSYF